MGEVAVPLVLSEAAAAVKPIKNTHKELCLSATYCSIKYNDNRNKPNIDFERLSLFPPLTFRNVKRHSMSICG